MKLRLFKPPYWLRQFFPDRIWGFSSSKVFLTFDDGPTAMTPWILDVLNSENVKATFFCVGNNVAKYPQLIQRMHDDGHAIGNHTMRHEKGTRTSLKEYLSSVAEADRLIESQLFRPPYGRMTRFQQRNLPEKYKVIMWSWLSYDFDMSVSTERILKNAERIQPGDILVLHDNLKVEERMKVLLPALIKRLKDRGCTFDVISV